MRTCRCRRCGTQLTIGHPEDALHERAEDLAREAGSWFGRLSGRTRRNAQRIETELVRAYYAADPTRQRLLPPRCPHCQYRAQGDLPWWEPGLST